MQLRENVVMKRTKKIIVLKIKILQNIDSIQLRYLQNEMSQSNVHIVNFHREKLYLITKIN